jgi:hypothetical protein
MTRNILVCSARRRYGKSRDPEYPANIRSTANSPHVRPAARLLLYRNREKRNLWAGRFFLRGRSIRPTRQLEMLSEWSLANGTERKPQLVQELNAWLNCRSCPVENAAIAVPLKEPTREQLAASVQPGRNRIGLELSATG